MRTVLGFLLYVIGGFLLINYFEIDFNNFLDALVWLIGFLLIGLGGSVQSYRKRENE